MGTLAQERMERLLAYCRVDDPDERDRLEVEMAWEAAVDYLGNAGVAEPEPGGRNGALFEQVAFALVLDELEQKGAQLPGVALVENPVFRRKLNQLKMVSDSDTGGGPPGAASEVHPAGG